MQKANVRRLEAGCQELQNKCRSNREASGTSKSKQQLIDEIQSKTEEMEKFERALKIAVANNNTLTKTIRFWKS